TPSGIPGGSPQQLVDSSGCPLDVRPPGELVRSLAAAGDRPHVAAGVAEGVLEQHRFSVEDRRPDVCEPQRLRPYECGVARAPAANLRLDLVVAVLQRPVFRGQVGNLVATRRLADQAAPPPGPIIERFL